MELNKNKSNRKIFNLIVLIGVVTILYFLISFVLLPNIAVLKTSFVKDGKLTFTAINKIFKSTRALDALKNSFLMAVTLPITVSIVGIIQVLLIDYFDIKGSKFLTLTYLIPLVFGGLLINNGYIFAYGPNGIFTNLVANINPGIDRYWFLGYRAALIAMTFGCTTNYMLFFRNSLSGIDYHTVEAAKNLGASQWTILSKVVFPQVRPMIITCVVLLFQQGLTAFAAPLILGGRDYQTIMPLILTLANRPASRDIAAILALLQGVFQIGVLFVVQRMEKGKNYMSISKTKANLKKQKIKKPMVNALFHIVAYLLALLNLIPFVCVLVFSFTDYQTIGSGRISLSSFTLENYKTVLTDPSAYEPFVTSVVYALLAALVVAIICIGVGRLSQKRDNIFTKILELLIYTPWILPGILFALGLIILYGTPQFWVGNNVLTGTLVIMLIAYIVVLLPNTYRFVRASYFGVNEELEEAAKNLGASKFYTFFKIVLPVIMPTVLAMFALNFNGKLSEYEISAFLFHPLRPTLGIVIRSNADATAAIDAKAINLVYSTILIAISMLVVWIVYYDGLNTIKSKFIKKKS
ncbi:iron ABC transporter permease [Anaerococcus sp. WCA-380-WT-2B]|uniref:Iron ABC transporter permease n=1 Tax=Anaerococcus porci TaxID=2652269 RepID=A0A6N7VFR8_9FIRM|nr:iron ABC transporter permease [Anaerococcus porci]MSS77731.1 iron ABC transporter permease [Anaerococcus porci]